MGWLLPKRLFSWRRTGAPGQGYDYGDRLNRTRISVIIAVLSVAVTVVISQCGVSARLERILWDTRLAMVADPLQADPGIKLVLIDQASLDYLKEEHGLGWPVPRELYSGLVKFFRAAGARGLAMDMIFSEPSPYGVGDDQSFATALKEAGALPVVLAVKLEERSVSQPSEAATLRIEGGMNAIALPPSVIREAPYFPEYARVTRPVGELERSVFLGSVNVRPDPDGIFRRYEPVSRIAHGIYLGLPLALYAAVNHTLPPLLASVLRDQGQAVVHLHGPSGTYHREHFANIVQSALALENGEKPLVDPASYRGSWVFLGPSAPGLMDLRSTPVDDIYPGVEFNATVLDNLLHDDFVRRAPEWVGYCTGALLALLAAGAILLSTATLPKVLFNLLLLVGLAVSGLAFAKRGVWIPAADPLFCFGFALITSLYFQDQFEGKQKRFLRSAFSRYVSPVIITQIMREPKLLTLGGERRELTIFFSDLEGFSSLSERLDPPLLVRLLNLVLSEMTQVILRERGTLDKYIGDAIVAFWNAPLPIEDHALCGVRAALACQQRLAELGPRIEAEFGVSAKMRIGMNSGYATVGNFGSNERFDYTMVGDAVNLASRLEGANKYFGTYFMVAEPTMQAVRGRVPMRQVGQVVVVGKDEVVRVFEPIAEDLFALHRDHFSRYECAREVFEQGDLAEALKQFTELSGGLNPYDPVVERYLVRIEQERARKVKERWNPVWQLSSK